MKNIVLIGFMGTGKTTIGKILAERLGLELVDLDTVIETREKKTVSEIFHRDGEARFRVLEKDAVLGVAGRTDLVVTTGGGVVLDSGNVEALRKNGILVELKASPETVYRRVRGSRKRPLLERADPLAEIRRLYGARTPLYAQCDWHFDTNDKKPSAVADEILGRLKNEDHG